MIAAVYIRKSREEKDKPAYRLDVQRRELPEAARRSGWEPVIYDDGYASAAKGKVANLPERGRMLADVQVGRVQVILTIELSRLSRDDTLQDYLSVLTLCAAHQVKLATPSRVLDPAQNSDWMLLLLEGGFSSVEMRQLKARMEEGRRAAYDRGAFLGGKPPAPYRLDNGRLVIDQAAAPRVLDMLNALTTMSANEVSQRYAEPYANVRRLASDARLDFFLARRQSAKTPGEWVECDWPPLITPDLAAAIRKARKERNARGGNSTAPARLLTGLGIFRCGYCGRSVKSWQNKAKDNTYQYYYCSIRSDAGTCPKSVMVPRAPIEEMVGHAMVQALSDPVKITEWIAEERTKSGDDAALDEYRKRYAELIRRKGRLVLAIENGTLEWADAKTRMQSIKSEMEEVEGKLAALSDGEPGPDVLSLAELPRLWESATLSERREMVEAAIESAMLYRNKLVLTFRFPIREDFSHTTTLTLPDFRALALSAARKRKRP